LTQEMINGTVSFIDIKYRRFSVRTDFRTIVSLKYIYFAHEISS